MKRFLVLIISFVLMISCKHVNTHSHEHAEGQDQNHSHSHETGDHSHGGEDLANLKYSREVHLKNVRQLTFGGDNAEAYWSFDQSKLVFQVKNQSWGVPCDQIYVMDAFEGLKDSTTIPQMISTGKGRTTCSYFLPGDSLIVFASTHLGGESCPPEPKVGRDRYVWPVYESYDIFVSDLEGNIVAQLTDEPGYDAEPTVSPKGDKIVFTSTRSGDLELYTMNLDGSEVRQVTNGLGYDGGAFFSPDGTKLIFRASRPETPEEIKKYKDLLSDYLVEPSHMELYVCNVDGTDLRKITDLGNANWAPFFHPSGEKVIFSSNHQSERGFPFNLFMINLDGTGLEQITFGEQFEAFPMFSPDGKYLVFASNRNNNGTRDTNLFVAEWVD